MTDIQVRAPKQSTATMLVPDGLNKDNKYRLSKFASWLDGTGADWFIPDLASYRDALLADRLADSTVSVHLSAVRTRYRALVRDRPLFFSMIPDGEFQERKAKVDELIKRIENAIDPKSATVKIETVQDVADSEHLRLTSEQASALLASPDLNDLKGLRDAAIIAVLLCTGIRERELSNLDVSDLRQTIDGVLSLWVRKGKGKVTRLVPYGELSWCLAIVDKWLDRAGIADGPVFRGLYKGGRKLRPGRLSVRGIEDILSSYVVMVDGERKAARPHDLRRTYARRNYQAGLGLMEIQQNLGHKDHKTTERYIGVLDSSKRCPKSLYSFDLSRLNSLSQLSVVG